MDDTPKIGRTKSDANTISRVKSVRMRSHTPTESTINGNLFQEKISKNREENFSGLISNRRNDPTITPLDTILKDLIISLESTQPDLPTGKAISRQTNARSFGESKNFDQKGISNFDDQTKFKRTTQTSDYLSDAERIRDSVYSSRSSRSGIESIHIDPLRFSRTSDSIYSARSSKCDSLFTSETASARTSQISDFSSDTQNVGSNEKNSTLSFAETSVKRDSLHNFVNQNSSYNKDKRHIHNLDILLKRIEQDSNVKSVSKASEKRSDLILTDKNLETESGSSTEFNIKRYDQKVNPNSEKAVYGYARTPASRPLSPAKNVPECSAGSRSVYSMDTKNINKPEDVSIQSKPVVKQTINESKNSSLQSRIQSANYNSNGDLTIKIGNEILQIDKEAITQATRSLEAAVYLAKLFSIDLTDLTRLDDSSPENPGTKRTEFMPVISNSQISPVETSLKEKSTKTTDENYVIARSRALSLGEKKAGFDTPNLLSKPPRFGTLTSAQYRTYKNVKDSPKGSYDNLSDDFGFKNPPSVKCIDLIRGKEKLSTNQSLSSAISPKESIKQFASRSLNEIVTLLSHALRSSRYVCHQKCLELVLYENSCHFV